MNKLGKKNNWAAYIYILPLMVLSFAAVYYCIIRTVMTSFTDWNGMSDTMNFVELKNYIKLFKDNTFWKAVVNNVIFFFGTVFVQAAVGFFLAVLLRKSCRVPICLKPSTLCLSPWRHPS